MSRYLLGGIVVLFLVLLLGWFALREEPRAPTESPPQLQPATMETQRETPDLTSFDDSTNAETAVQAPDSTITNAADLYRQAFALYNALTNDEKEVLRDWKTNVDASIEAALCEKIRPICDLMHQAGAVTNCDWGIEPMTFDTKLSFLAQGRNLARAAIWSAAHCRSDNATGATDDSISVLRLGQQSSRAAMIGCLVDIALQGMTSSYVAQHVRLFNRADTERLVQAFNDLSYEDAPSHAMQQEAEMVQQLAEHEAALPEDQLQKELSQMGDDTNLFSISRTAALAQLQQVVDSDKDLANVLSSSSEENYDRWHQQETAIEATSPLAKELLAANDGFVNEVQAAGINRAMAVTGLVIAQAGPDALASHLDPSSGQPFVYTKTDDGFQLQSSYQLNGKPLTMQFKQQ